MASLTEADGSGWHGLDQQVARLCTLTPLLPDPLIVQAASLPAEQRRDESCATQAATRSSHEASLNPRLIQTVSVQSAGTRTGLTARGETRGKGEYSRPSIMHTLSS